MTTEALTTMVIVWTIVIFFAGFFLLKVIRTPQEKNKQKGNEGTVPQQNSSQTF